MNTYIIKTQSTYNSYNNVSNADVLVYVNGDKLENTKTDINKVKRLNNYNETNNVHFDSYQLPEKLRKHFRYDVKCPVQSAWMDYYKSKRRT